MADLNQAVRVEVVKDWVEVDASTVLNDNSFYELLKSCFVEDKKCSYTNGEFYLNKTSGG